ncbi:SNU23 [[Candida] subhashii]|uniref:SNU23 n=1 Tax=[Candida] subhashii TaxID=561895 RepID=A0A8J5QP97_9ASCO|nr:SNU23 [[Candida] subhashii]KAG7665338.1 SNU23 [[Candida] subhashii]
MSEESDKLTTTDQYGRKKWNIEIYEQQAKSKHTTQPTTTNTSPLIQDESSSSEFIKHRNKLLKDSLGAVKTYNLISPTSGSSSKTYGSNKRFGFFCPVCDLSFRDNLALIDHLNSPQHVQKVNQVSRESRRAKQGMGEGEEGEEEEVGELDGGIRRADLGEVVKMIERLVNKSIRSKDELSNKNNGGLSFTERVERRRKFEQDKRLKRQEKRQRRRKKQKLIENDQQQQGETNDEMSSFMGFSNFGSSKR